MSKQIPNGKQIPKEWPKPSTVTVMIVPQKASLIGTLVGLEFEVCGPQHECQQ